MLAGHLREMIPIVNDLTVGMAMRQYHNECRRPRGVYLSIDHVDGIEAVLAGPWLIGAHYARPFFSFAEMQRLCENRAVRSDPVCVGFPRGTEVFVGDD
jgi:Malic enzyme, N-terminal domain